MTGYASYDDAFDAKYGKPFDVPLVRATEKSLTDLGRLVHDYDAEEVIMLPWPQTGKRPLCAGSGIGATRETGVRYWWKEDRILGKHHTSTNPTTFSVGRRPKGVAADCRTHSLCREANYHPDSGQVFMATDGKPLIAVLAKPGDDVKLEDFKAYYFDGSCGFQIFPCVWHQHLYPAQESVCIKSKQSFALPCVTMDTVDEHSIFMRVPLQEDLITG